MTVKEKCKGCIHIEYCGGSATLETDSCFFKITTQEAVWNNTNKWIPISERLPEEAGMYLCSYDDDYVGTSYFDIRMNEFNMLHEQVTAWMYIPKPYQPEIPTGAEGSDKE